MFLNDYPYTDFHEMNLDFLLKSMEELKKAFASFTASNSLIFAEPMLHDLTSTYAKNTIVLDSDGNAYISLQNVPAGVQLSNADYWLMVFNFEEYTEKANKNFTVNYLRDTTRAPQAYVVGDWLVLDDVLYTVTQAIAADELLVPGTNLTHFTVEQFLKDFVTSVNNTLDTYSRTIQQYKDDIDASELQYKNDIDASELAYRNQLAQDIADTTASLQTQLDQAISGATVDSEVINARIGANDITYTTLGHAIRNQLEMLSDLTFGDIISEKYVDYRDGTEQASVSYYCTDFIDIRFFDLSVLTYAANDYSGVVFYNASKQYISGSKAVLISGTETTLTKPSGAAYVRISCIDNRINDLIIKYTGISQSLITAFAGKLSTTNAVTIAGGVGASFDANTINTNFIYNIAVNTLTANANHVPVDGFMGSIFPIAGSNSAVDLIELAFRTTTSPEIYYRSRISGVWNAWVKIPKSGDFLPYTNAVVVAGGVTTSYDFDNANVNYILNAVSGYFTKAANHVPFDGFTGSIWTISGANSATDTYTQIAFVTTASPAIWIRVKQYGGTWTNWSRLSLTTELNANIRQVREDSKRYNIFKAFDNIVCCGDSLTACYVYTGVGTYRIAHKTYPEILAEESGANVTALANGGLSASDWWNDYNSNIVSTTNQLAIIYLGTNGGLTDTLDTDAPAANPYTDWANTNTGSYAKIIAKYQSVGAKVLLVKVYASSGDMATTNDVIEQCATRFHCGIVENDGINKFSLHAYPDLSGDGGAHYNDLGYAVFTDQLIQNAGLMDTNYQKYIIPA